MLAQGCGLTGFIMSIDEESFLETPSYVLALVLVGFQLAALLFTSTGEPPLHEQPTMHS